MKSQTARVVLIRNVPSLLAIAARQWDELSNLDGAQRAVASICGLHFSKSIRTSRAGAVLRQLPEKMSRSRRWANVNRGKFANNRRPLRRTSKPSRGGGKTTCKTRQSHCWWLRVPKEMMVQNDCDPRNRKIEWSVS